MNQATKSLSHSNKLVREFKALVKPGKYCSIIVLIGNNNKLIKVITN